MNKLADEAHYFLEAARSRASGKYYPANYTDADPPTLLKTLDRAFNLNHISVYSVQAPENFPMPRFQGCNPFAVRSGFTHCLWTLGSVC
jgi:hypothetical protein